MPADFLAAGNFHAAGREVVSVGADDSVGVETSGEDSGVVSGAVSL